MGVIFDPSSRTELCTRCVLGDAGNRHIQDSSWVVALVVQIFPFLNMGGLESGAGTHLSVPWRRDLTQENQVIEWVNWNPGF